MTFRVGQKVVCVRADWRFRFPSHPVLRGVYTIREIVDYPNDTPGLRFNEFHHAQRQWADGFKENTYESEWFRPLIDTTKQVDEMRELIRPIFEGKEVELVQ